MNSNKNRTFISKASSSNVIKPIRKEAQNWLSRTNVVIRCAVIIGKADVIDGCHVATES